MGKKRHFRGNNAAEDKQKRREAAEQWKRTRGDETNNGWDTSVMVNKRFEAFYKAQKFVSSGDDWDSFLQHLRTPLPACFRINPDYPFIDELRKQLMSFAGKKIKVDGSEIDAVQELRWYPNGSGYKLGTDRRSIRKLKELAALKQWMIQHTDNGNITRQEAVSMVPPLALDVSPHHKCLDMCASPGSKTTQMLEIVTRSFGGPAPQQGLVVANDCDTDRAYMLVHQCKRINSPQLVVTTHQGQNFPSIVSPQQQGPGVSTTDLFFDRVLCDVPCAGDGTMRKNPPIWGRWSTGMSTGLHPLQLMIARRGLELLKPDGLLVYSTCSMSPYEDEAVVAQLLRENPDTLELVEARQYVPGFNARPGISNWLVLDDFLAIRKEKREHFAAKKKEKQRKRDEKRREEALTSQTPGDGGLPGEPASEEPVAKKLKTEDPEANPPNQLPKEDLDDDANAEEGDDGNVELETTDGAPVDFSSVADRDLRACLEMGMSHYPSFAEVPEGMKKKMRESLFPPSPEEQQRMHLERCLRCVPQDEDTGGFFVATLRKKQLPPGGTFINVGNEEVGEDVVVESRSKGKGLVDFCRWEEAAYTRMRDFFGLDVPQERFLVQDSPDNNPQASGKKRRHGNGTVSKSVYLIPHSAHQLLEGDVDGRLKVVTMGVKAFEKKILNSGDVDYRLLQDGIGYLAPHIQKRKVAVTVQDFCNMLDGGLVSFATLSDATTAAFRTLKSGVVVCCYRYQPLDCVEESASEGQASIGGAGVAGDHEFFVVGWIGGSTTINVMCGKVEMESLKHQLAALNVLRPKQMAIKRLYDAPNPVPEETSGEQKTTEEAAQEGSKEVTEQVGEATEAGEG